jgi:hypothetical protein
LFSTGHKVKLSEFHQRYSGEQDKKTTTPFQIFIQLKARALQPVSLFFG